MLPQILSGFLNNLVQQVEFSKAIAKQFQLFRDTSPLRRPTQVRRLCPQA